jgi:hypothetical protein
MPTAKDGAGAHLNRFRSSLSTEVGEVPATQQPEMENPMRRVSRMLSGAMDWLAKSGLTDQASLPAAPPP